MNYRIFNRRIMSACKKGDLIKVHRMLLELDTYKKYIIQNLFIQSVRNQHLNIADFILQKGGIVDIRNDKCFVKALKYCAYFDPQMVGLLMNKEEYFFISDENNHLEVLEIFLKSNIDCKYLEECSLRCAARYNHLKVILLLIKYGININAEDSSALVIACVNQKIELCKLLIEKGSNVTSFCFRTPAKEGNYELMKLLIENCADYKNIKENWLVETVLYGQFEIVKLIMESGGVFDQDAVSKAVTINNIQIMSYFLEMGKDIHGEKNSSIINAVNYGHFEMVKFLVENGADVNAFDNTAVKLSITKGNFDIVKYLFENGVDFSNGCYLVLAVVYLRIEIVQFLLDNGADVHWNDDEVFRRAARMGDLEIVKLLIEYGAYVNNNSALMNAVERKNLSIIRFLIENGANSSIVPIEIMEKIFFKKKPDEMIIRNAEFCPISYVKLTDEIPQVVCGNCNNIFFRDALNKWVDNGKACPYKCGSKTFYCL